MSNKIKGEVTLPGLGVLRFDWDALASIEGKFEKQTLDLQERLSELAVLTAFVKAGLIEPVDEAEIKENIFPLLATIAAVREALALAYFGPKGTPNADDPGNAPPPQKKS